MKNRLRRIEDRLSRIPVPTPTWYYVKEDKQGRWWVRDPDTKQDRLVTEEERHQLECQPVVFVVCRD